MCHSFINKYLQEDELSFIKPSKNNLKTQYITIQYLQMAAELSSSPSKRFNTLSPRLVSENTDHIEDSSMNRGAKGNWKGIRKWKEWKKKEREWEIWSIEENLLDRPFIWYMEYCSNSIGVSMIRDHFSRSFHSSLFSHFLNFLSFFLIIYPACDEWSRLT